MRIRKLRYSPEPPPTPEHARRSYKVSEAGGARGFTLVELLVVIAIIAMFMTALFPAVQAMRSTARRAQCRNQMLQLVMAMQNFEMAQEHFPAGVEDSAPGPIRSVEEGQHRGWTISLLPYMDEANVFRRVDQDVSVYDPKNAEIRQHVIQKLVCPADITDNVDAQSSYAACHHGQEAAIDSNNNGVFFLNSQIMLDDVRDGLSQTIFLGEKLLTQDDLGWMSGTRATLRNTGSVVNKRRGPGNLVVTRPKEPESYEDEAEDEAEEGNGLQADSKSATSDSGGAGEAQTPLSDPTLFVGGFGSSHQSGAHVTFGDGRIQFMTQLIDPQVFQQLGDRDDGALLNLEEYRE